MLRVTSRSILLEEELNRTTKTINKVRERANVLPQAAGEVILECVFDQQGREFFIKTNHHAQIIKASFILSKLNLQGYNLE